MKDIPIDETTTTYRRPNHRKSCYRIFPKKKDVFLGKNTTQGKVYTKLRWKIIATDEPFGLQLYIIEMKSDSKPLTQKPINTNIALNVY